MLTYKAAYQLVDGIFLAEVLDFPGTVSFGYSLEEARGNLAGALMDMAETNLLQGEALPLPDSSRLQIGPNNWWPKARAKKERGSCRLSAKSSAVRLSTVRIVFLFR